MTAPGTPGWAPGGASGPAAVAVAASVDPRRASRRLKETEQRYFVENLVE